MSGSDTSTFPQRIPVYVEVLNASDDGNTRKTEDWIACLSPFLKQKGTFNTVCKTNTRTILIRIGTTTALLRALSAVYPLVLRNERISAGRFVQCVRLECPEKPDKRLLQRATIEIHLSTH